MPIEQFSAAQASESEQIRSHSQSGTVMGSESRFPSPMSGRARISVSVSMAAGFASRSSDSARLVHR